MFLHSALPGGVPSPAAKQHQVFWGKKIFVGLDLGSFALKVCTREVSGTTCSYWFESLLPKRSGKDDHLAGQALQQRVEEMLQGAQAHFSPWAQQVDVSLEGSSSSSGYLSLPLLRPDQLRVAIPSAVAREIPHALSEVQIFSAQVPALTEPENRMGIFYVAVPNTLMHDRGVLLTSLGYQVHSYEPGLIATLLGVKSHRKLAEGEAVAIIDCGFRHTTVIMTLGGHPYASREFRLAGADFTQAFQAEDDLSWSDAEEQKKNYNVAQRAPKVEALVTRWLGEVKRSVNFVSQAHPTLKPTRIILTGGTSCWPGLTQRLSDFLCLAAVEGPTAPDNGCYDAALGMVSR